MLLISHPPPSCLVVLALGLWTARTGRSGRGGGLRAGDWGRCRAPVTLVAQSAHTWRAAYLAAGQLERRCQIRRTWLGAARRQQLTWSGAAPGRPPARRSGRRRSVAARRSRRERERGVSWAVGSQAHARQPVPAAGSVSGCCRRVLATDLCVCPRTRCIETWSTAVGGSCSPWRWTGEAGRPSLG